MARSSSLISLMTSSSFTVSKSDIWARSTSSKCFAFGLDVSSLDTLRNSGNRAALTGEIDKVDNVLLQRKREWLRAISDLRDFIEKDMKGFADLQKEYTNIINANEVHTSNYYGDCITKLQQALSKAKTDLQKAKAEVAKGGENGQQQTGHRPHLPTDGPGRRGLLPAAGSAGAGCGPSRTRGRPLSARVLLLCCGH